MITLTDVLHHIAQQLTGYSGTDNPGEIQEFVLATVSAIELSITTDLEETELRYLELYGKGSTHYFRLRDEQHGKVLSEALCQFFGSKTPDRYEDPGSSHESEAALYLFVHLTSFPLQPKLSISA
jgi:hypothetical protein